MHTDGSSNNMRYLMPLYPEQNYHCYRPSCYVMPIRNVHYTPQRSLSPICSKYDLINNNMGTAVPLEVHLLGPTSVPVVQRYSWPFYPGGCDAYRDRSQVHFGSPMRPIFQRAAMRTPRAATNHRHLLIPPQRFKLDDCSRWKYRGRVLQQ